MLCKSALDIRLANMRTIWLSNVDVLRLFQALESNAKGVETFCNRKELVLVFNQKSANLKHFNIKNDIIISVDKSKIYVQSKGMRIFSKDEKYKREDLFILLK